MTDAREPGDRPVIVFDGQCVLCSRGARFVLKHDRKEHFLLASVQSEAGGALCRRFGVNRADPETMLLIDHGRARRQSDAMLAICRGLGWPWRVFTLFRIVPRPLRDAAYRWVARRRYRLFGRRETCWLPDEAWKGRVP
jgi:predicted DCC family thiol-disulfide oxidoreductase YuxK